MVAVQRQTDDTSRGYFAIMFALLLIKEIPQEILVVGSDKKALAKVVEKLVTQGELPALNTKETKRVITRKSIPSSFYAEAANVFHPQPTENQ